MRGCRGSEVSLDAPCTLCAKPPGRHPPLDRASAAVDRPIAAACKSYAVCSLLLNVLFEILGKYLHIFHVYCSVIYLHLLRFAN